MSVAKACYRNLRGYKYQLVKSYTVQIDLRPAAPIDTPFVTLDLGGLLTIKAGYAWDGPSGPTIDTPSFMRGSLVHDALYQLIRLRKLDKGRDRSAADAILKKICREDGMWAFRAWYVHLGVRWFAGGAANPALDQEDTIICVPK